MTRHVPASLYARETVQLIQQETPEIFIYLPVKQSGRLQNLATDAGTCVRCTRYMSATPAT